MYHNLRYGSRKLYIYIIVRFIGYRSFLYAIYMSAVVKYIGTKIVIYFYAKFI